MVNFFGISSRLKRVAVDIANIAFIYLIWDLLSFFFFSTKWVES